MSSDELLQAKAFEAMRAGHLPRRSPHKLWGGPATGARCAVCGVPTTPGEVELELEFTGDSNAGRAKYQAHPRCFAIFSRELDRQPSIGSGTQQAAGSVDGKAPDHDAS